MSIFSRAKSVGFTLVELIIVIVLLAILSAFAVPKFINLTRSANKATVGQIFASFQSAVNLAHAKWMLKGKPATITMQGSVIPMTSTGWPGSNAMTNVACEALWHGVMTNSTTSINRGVEHYTDNYSIFGQDSFCYFHYANPQTRFLKYETDTGVLTIVNN
ncbi:MAG: prepilin-type N-terminal cleavage/methylation domain-containing protein [Coxiellaceae bacterium]|nr:prepilin-type N-terminal cleavage/methylation domain-containing protein [Coxiellaceae bacterium]